MIFPVTALPLPSYTLPDVTSSFDVSLVTDSFHLFSGFFSLIKNGFGGGFGQPSRNKIYHKMYNKKRMPNIRLIPTLARCLCTVVLAREWAAPS